MSDQRRPILILGTYAFAEEVADLISETAEWRTAGFVENLDRSRCEAGLLGKPVHWVDDLGVVGRDHHLICAIGTTKRRSFIDQVGPLELPFATLVHPSARVSATSRIGAGCIISAGVIIAAHSEIGGHSILNRGVMVGHHTRIGSCVTISPGANIAGKCSIEDGSYVAMGAIVLDGRSVGRGSVIAAGSLVTRDVPEHVQVVGSPARITKVAIDGR
jgi:sugar O-acyltransferase (sialic acid O-acetyltransferase NeuD family)